MSIVRPYDVAALKAEFQSAEPFPHMVIDDFLDADFVRALAASYPSYGEALVVGREFDALNERSKIQVTDSAKFPEPVSQLHQFLASSGFLQDLSEITGIPSLLADEELKGGGIHVTGPGGRLDVHIDFNFDEARKYHRRLNILIYLNEGWQSSWGGQLELWDRHVRQCHRVVEPELNRCVVFETSEISFHGVRPIKRSANRPRQSFAAYYYTREAPEGWSGENHSTVFRSRPTEIVRGKLLMPLHSVAQIAGSGVRRVRRFARKLLSRA